MKKINITTLGCKVNQFESASIQSRFEDLGHHVISSGTSSDIVVINTCSVTDKAGAESRRIIRKALRDNPEARIVITGCYSQLETKKLEKMKEIKGRSVSIIGNGDKHLLVDAALNDEGDFSILSRPIEKADTITPLTVKNFGSRTRAYLRIQDGCNAFCTYCIVPYTRGRSRSLSVNEVLKQAKVFEEQGYKEIVITGIHVGYYGADLDDQVDISSIMHQLCVSTPNIRYRLSSIEPLEISNKLLETMAYNDNFMPHLHIPLQSGNDDILLRMNRRYTTQQFSDVLGFCKSKVKDLAIGIDVLAGFPGETDEQFSEAWNFLNGLECTYLHVFPYSRRPGTPAADFPDQIPKNIREARVKSLRELGELKKSNFYKKFLGNTRDLLVEGKRDVNGLLRGFTDNYIPVSFSGSNNLQKCIIKVRLDNADNTYIQGSAILE